MNEFNEADIIAIFSPHYPSPEECAVYEKINDLFLDFAKKIIPLLPSGPGKTATIRHLADSQMKFKAAVSLKGKF